MRGAGQAAGPLHASAPGVNALPRWLDICSPSQAVLMHTLRTPARASASRCQRSKGLPRTASKGLGVWSVSGRMRSPRPAANSSAWAGNAVDWFTTTCPMGWSRRARPG